MSINSESAQHLRSMILGALVADAAAVGFHWLYDQDRIRDIAKDTPEFHPPTQTDYENTLGFFAHTNKHVGDFSQYGEQAMVLLRSLAETHGNYDKKHYQESFQKHFGYGGPYIGYIDHPTRETLDNIAAAERDIIARCKQIPFTHDDNTQRMMFTKVLANVKKFKDLERVTKIEEAVRQTHDDDEMVTYALRIAAEFDRMLGYHGANDEQLPAVSKLPPLIAAYSNNDKLLSVVESAVRVTNDNELAVQTGQAVALIIQSALNEDDPLSAVTKGSVQAHPTIKTYIDQALSYTSESHLVVTSRFGMSCHLTYGVPSAVHNLATSASFREAIRKNIYAGGDSCGRAMFLGAVLGAIYGIGGEKGIPLDWLDKIRQKNEVFELLQTLGYV